MTNKKTKSLQDISKSIPINLIDSDTVFEGSIKCGGDIRIDGKYKGDLNVKGDIVIGKTGVIEGNINAKNAYIYGNFSGKINIKEDVEIGPIGKVKGDLLAKKIEIKRGAQVEATIETIKETTTDKK